MDSLITHLAVPALVGMINQLPLGSPVGLDTETTGLFPYQSDVLRGVSIAFHPTGQLITSFYIPVGYEVGSLHPADLRAIFGALKARRPFLVLHHGKFDFAFLRQLCLDKDGSVFFPFPEPHEWWDTKVVAWLIDENLSNGLKEQAAYWWGEDEKAEQTAIKKLVRAKGWGGITAAEIAPYAAKDAELTLRLYHVQKNLLATLATGNPKEAVERELAIQGVLYRMAQTGILVNPELIEKMRAEAVDEIAGIESSFTINLNSPMQLAKMLGEHGVHLTSKTKAGKLSTSRDALEALEGQHPILAPILRHRRLRKALTGYLIPLAERIGYDGRIHPNFNSTGTVTGRFSCSEPNLQTIPRADTLKGVRDVFIAEDQHELLEFDLQAAEMRVTAGMADETVLIDALNEGRDMHGELAARVFGPDYTPLQRRFAKNLGYGWYYGLTSTKTAAKYISGPDAEEIAGKILNGLKQMYPRVYRLMNRTTRLASKEGFLPINEAWPGRYRRFQTPGRRAFAYTGLNAMVQGTIAEIMKSVMLIVEGDLSRLGARLCLQVHDSLVIEAPIGTREKVLAILQSALDDVNPCAMRHIFECSEWSDHA